MEAYPSGLAFPQEGILRILFRHQLFGPLAQGCIRLKNFPSPAHHGDHRVFPILALQHEGRRLHRALNQQAGTGPTLGGAGDFASVPEEIKLLMTHEALAGR